MLLWRLVEDAPQLMALCREAGIPCDDLKEAPAKRQRERAAERLLMCHAFGHHVLLSHTAQGVPMVVGGDVNVSISHTQGLVALAIDPERIIGVDAEQTDRHQVLRVRDKFLNTKEKDFIAPDDLAAHIIAWTAKEAIIKASKETGCIVTCEEHSIIGGLGSAVAEVLVENAPCPMLRVGVNDEFGRSGTPAELMAYYHLTGADIADKAKKVIALKG